MKIIALRDFLNVPSLNIKLDKSQNPISDRFIHKGAIFEVGRSEKFNELTPQEQQTVSLLNLANCIGDANNEKTVAAVNKEIPVLSPHEGVMGKGLSPLVSPKTKLSAATA